MTSPAKKYEQLIKAENFKDLNESKKLNFLAELIDLSGELGEIEGLKIATNLGEELYKEISNPTSMAELNYFLGNAWSNMGALDQNTNQTHWNWEDKKTEKEIFYFRLALKTSDTIQLEQDRENQILTNLANALNRVGRPITAFEYWNRAIISDPHFGMAKGNSGVALKVYGETLEDNGQRGIIFKFAYEYLKNAISSAKLQGIAPEAFKDTLSKIEDRVGQNLLPDFVHTKPNMEGFSLGDTAKEKEYRKWCLKNKLFLNPLNDLGSFSIAAEDNLKTPMISASMDDPPIYQGFFSQMKQEFVSARYLYYEGTHSNNPHFSDEKVDLANTLESYSQMWCMGA